ncbi:MAG TPA: hypothetical protein V6D07_04685 [Trichocoleus sp.]
MGEVIVAKTLLGENVSAYFDVKSCKHSKAGLFVLGLTVLVNSQAQASTMSLERNAVVTSQDLLSLQVAAQNRNSSGFEPSTGLPLNRVAQNQSGLTETLLSVGKAEDTSNAQFSSVKTPSRVYPIQASSRTGNTSIELEGEHQEIPKVLANFETLPIRNFADQRLETSTNFEKTESGKLISTSASDLASHNPATSSDLLQVQRDGKVAVFTSSSQERTWNEHFDFDFVKREESLDDRFPLPQTPGLYEDPQSELIGQRSTDDSEEAEAEENPNIEDPELGIIRIRSAVEDPELGIIRIREQLPDLPTPSASEAAPIAFLTSRLSFVNSNNIFLSVDPVLGVIGDQSVRPGISLGIYPALAEQTFLIATADLNFQRYINNRAANYDELRLRLGIRQGLTPRSYIQLSGTYQELFRPTLKDRFFSNDALELLLARRDSLTPELALNSYYQVQMNFSTPQSFDRLIQFAGAYLSYQVTPRWQVGLNYQLTLADYTSFERFDTYQQVIGQLVYQLSPDVRLNLFGGVSFGRSSIPSVRLDDTIVGISLEGTWALF